MQSAHDLLLSPKCVLMSLLMRIEDISSVPKVYLH